MKKKPLIADHTEEIIADLTNNLKKVFDHDVDRLLRNHFYAHELKKPKRH